VKARANRSDVKFSIRNNIFISRHSHTQFTTSSYSMGRPSVVLLRDVQNNLANHTPFKSSTLARNDLINTSTLSMSANEAIHVLKSTHGLLPSHYFNIHLHRSIYFCLYPFWVPGSSVGIATGCGMDNRGVVVLVPVGSTIFIPPYCPDRLWVHSASYSLRTGGSFPGDKAAGA
jgi:hypothetical protein